MSRVATTQYGADVDTQFQWATDDNDPFDRELDMSFVARALERHDHSNARGLAVTRIGNNVITTAMFQAQSVDTTAILNLAVTTPKINDLAVTKPKLASPLVQSANTIVGGLRLADTTQAFTSSWFVDANGNVGLTSNQSFLALNVMQNNNIVIGQTLPAANYQARLTISQQLGSQPYGLTFVDTTNLTYQTTMWQAGGGQFFILAGNFHFVLDTANASVRPNIDAGINLGFPSTRWLNVYSVNGTFNGAVTVSGGLVAGALTSTGAIASTTGIFAGTTLSVAGIATMAAINCGAINTQNSGITMGAGGITGATGAFTSTLSCAGLTCTTLGCTAITCTTINTQNNAINAGTGVITSGAINASGSVTVGGNVLPAVDNGQNCGVNGQAWFGVNTHTAAKDGGGAWAVLSDVRAKNPDTFAPLQYGLAEVLRLEPYWYEYTGEYGALPGRRHVGVKAQDVREIMPEMVQEVEIKRRPDSKAPTKMLQVDPSMLDWVYAKAIQELEARVAALEHELNNRRN